MSCIRFSTKPQREAIRDAAALGTDGVVLHLAPPVTASKLARLRLLAEHVRPGIRRSVASNRHAPADLLARLAADPDAGVRGEVARNDSTAAHLVAALAGDVDARVRCWAVLNPLLPDATVRAMAEDRDPQVRRLAAWRLGAAQPV